MNARGLTRWLLVLAGVLALWPSIGHAQPDPPRPGQLDTDARAAFAEQRYRDAAELFERAQRLSPHPATQFNAALSWDRAGELARAADSYEAAISMAGLRIEMAETARTRLAVLKKSLGYIQVSEPVGETVSVAHAKDASIPINVHVSPGKYRVVVRRRDGATIERVVDALAGQVVPLAITDKPIGVRTPTTPTNQSRSETPAPSPGDDRARHRRTWGFIALGGATLAAAGAIASGLKMRSELDTFEESGRRDLEARDAAIRYKLWANVLAGTAIVAGGAGIYLLLSDSGSSNESKAKSGSVRLRVGTGTLDATLRF